MNTFVNYFLIKLTRKNLRVTSKLNTFTCIKSWTFSKNCSSLIWLKIRRNNVQIHIRWTFYLMSYCTWHRNQESTIEFEYVKLYTISINFEFTHRFVSYSFHVQNERALHYERTHSTHNKFLTSTSQNSQRVGNLKLLHNLKSPRINIIPLSTLSGIDLLTAINHLSIQTKNIYGRLAYPTGTKVFQVVRPSLSTGRLWL